MVSSPVPARLDAAETVSGVPTRALTSEFSWDEVTELRHRYLMARHAERYHAEEWHAAVGLPDPLAALVDALVAVVGFPHPDTHTSQPSIDRVRHLSPLRVAAVLRSLVSDPEKVRRTWASGLLRVLILQFLRFETDGLIAASWDVHSAMSIDGVTMYGIEVWRPVSCDEVVMEGLCEDVAYTVLSHDEDVAVSIESRDGGTSFYAASKGLVIGADPLEVPAQGDVVRLRTWRQGRTRILEQASPDVAFLLERAEERVFEDEPESAAMVRVVLLADQAEVAPIAWSVWSAAELFERNGWLIGDIVDEDEWDDDDSEGA